MQQMPMTPPSSGPSAPRQKRPRTMLVVIIVAVVAVLLAGVAVAATASLWAGNSDASDREPRAGASAATPHGDEANTAETNAEEELKTYHHEGFGVWFDYPQAWSVEAFPSNAEAEARGFITYRSCGNIELPALEPVRVLDGDGREVAALGIPGERGGCAGESGASTVQVIDEAPVHLSGQGPVRFVYLTTADATGGRYPVMGLTASNLGEDALAHTMSFNAQSEQPAQRYALSFASTVVFSPEVNQLDVTDSQLPAFASAGEAEAYTETPEFQQLRAMYSSTRNQEDPAVLSGDLGLTQTISYPACDGTQIAVLGTSWTPENYQAEVQRYLDGFPGSMYSRTDFLCSSFLRPELDNSDDAYIYFVYTPTGDDQAATCAAVANAIPFVGNAHGKWLRNEGKPGEQVPC